MIINNGSIPFCPNSKKNLKKNKLEEIAATVIKSLIINKTAAESVNISKQRYDFIFELPRHITTSINTKIKIKEDYLKKISTESTFYKEIEDFLDFYNKMNPQTILEFYDLQQHTQNYTNIEVDYEVPYGTIFSTETVKNIIQNTIQKAQEKTFLNCDYTLLCKDDLVIFKIKVNSQTIKGKIDRNIFTEKYFLKSNVYNFFTDLFYYIKSIIYEKDYPFNSIVKNYIDIINKNNFDFKAIVSSPDSTFKEPPVLINTFKPMVGLKGGIHRTDNKTKRINNFYISKSFVTNEEWSRIMNYKKSDFPDSPVSSISLPMAFSFCNILSKKEGLECFYTLDKDNNYHINREANGYFVPSVHQLDYALKSSKRKLIETSWLRSEITQSVIRKTDIIDKNNVKYVDYDGAVNSFIDFNQQSVTSSFRIARRET